MTRFQRLVSVSTKARQLSDHRPPVGGGAMDAVHRLLHPKLIEFGKDANAFGFESIAGAVILAARSSSALKDREFADSPLEEAGFELVWGFSCQVVVSDL